MKKIFTSFGLVLIIGCLCAQNRIWQFDIDVIKQNVRTDTAYQLLKQEINIPTKGTVIVRFEGEAFASSFDRIVLGVNDMPTISPNFGNTQVFSTDTIHNWHNFVHTRLYKVDKGIRNYYALVWNLVGRGGTGITSVRGRLIIEFIPDGNSANELILKEEVIYPIVLQSNYKIMDSIVMNLTEPGKILLSFDGRIYSLPKNEISLIIRDQITGKILREFTSIHLTVDKLPIFMLPVVLDAKVGLNKFTIEAKIISGDTSNTNNAFYGVFYATFQANSITSRIMQSSSFIGAFDTLKNKLNLKNLNFDVPSNGKLMIMYSGYAHLNLEDKIDFSAKITSKSKIVTADASAMNTIPGEDKASFNRVQVLDVVKGVANITLDANLINRTAYNQIKNINGELVIQFIADINTRNTDIERSEPKNTYLVYPNPMENQFQISSSEQAIFNTPANIFNDKGQFIKAVLLSDKAVDISELPVGKYYIQLLSKQNIEIIPLIKGK